MSEYDLIPELGDLITIHSDLYKTTTGRIIYRDGSLIRIRPTSSSTTAVDFELVEETQQFLENLGVTEIIIHEKRKFPHFSRQLGAAPGEMLEFFDTKGNPAGESGIVFEVIATDTEDGIKLESGIVYDFGFIGATGGTAENPIAVLRVRAPPQAELPPENNSTTAEATEAAGNAEAENADADANAFPDIDFDILPIALVEEVPTQEQTFSDSVQREDMFVSLLVDVPVKRQKDPKIMQNLYRATDVLLALKNSVVLRDEGGAVVPGIRSYTPATVQDVVALQPTGAPISAILPVASVKKRLYSDDTTTDSLKHVEFRNDTMSLAAIMKPEAIFANYIQGQNAFATYLFNVLKSTEAYVPASEQTSAIQVDQDVLRSANPMVAVEGFPEVPEAFIRGVQKPDYYRTFDSDSLGTIEQRMIRLIGPSYVTNAKTGNRIVVAPADTGNVVETILLPLFVVPYRAPTRSSVLLWDMQASEVSRNNRKSFYKALLYWWDFCKIIKDDEEISLEELLTERLFETLSMTNQETLETLDALGLRNLEFSEKVFSTLSYTISEGCKTWDGEFAELQKRAMKAIQVPSRPAVPATVSIDAPLYVAPLANPLLAKVVKRIQDAQTPELANYDLLLANDLLRESETTLGAYWYAVAGQLPPDVVISREITYKLQADCENRKIAVKRDIAKEFYAAPTINKCPHVHELEKVRGVRLDSTRMLLLEAFLKKYRGAQQGNWIQCNTCSQDLMCKHEVLLLNEFLNPGRGSSLHKSLLLEYAGPVFEGAYICKNCGQKIRDIEYDTHLEFDDEGRPMVGRTVIEPDTELDFDEAGGDKKDGKEKENEKAKAKDETDLAMVFSEEVAVPFKREELALYYNFRAVFERCGLVVDMATYQRVVSAAQDFLKMYVPPEASYVKRQQALAAAKKPQDIPYKAYDANYKIGIVGALVLLELQTSSINIPIPATGCPFSRDGFPLDGTDMSTAGTGAFHYIVCVLTTIIRRDSPWVDVPWAGLTGKQRQAGVEAIMKRALYAILCFVVGPGGQAPPPITTVSDTYLTKLRDAAAQKAAKASGTTGAALASNSDILPGSYRPMPHVVIAATEAAVGNAAQFDRNVRTGDVSAVGPVVRARQHQIAQQIVADTHKHGKETAIIVANNPRSDSVCCFSRLGAVAKKGMGIMNRSDDVAQTNEMDAHTAASAIIERRDPALSATGTHIIVPWSAPKERKEIPSADSSMYYKLFLKHCYRGTQYGMVHEFGLDFTCRRCQFHYPEELLYLTSADVSATNDKVLAKIMDEMNLRRKEIALEAFATAGVVINTMTFNNLEMAIRQRRRIIPVEPVVILPFLTLLESIQPLVDVSAEATADWIEVRKAFHEIQKTQTAGLGRIGKLAEFSRRYNLRLGALRDKMSAVIVGAVGSVAPGMPKLSKMQEQVVQDALQQIELLTEDGSASVRNIANIFVIGATKLCKERPNPMATEFSKLIPNISMHHRGLLMTIWEKQGQTTANAIKKLRELDDDDEVAVIKTALNRFAETYGSFLNIWLNSMRPNTGFTPEEYRYVLRWSVYTMLNSLLTETSVFYRDSPSVGAKRNAIRFIQGWLLESLSSADAEREIYQMTPEQITDALNVRAELEKAAFIAKFDKLDRDLRKAELMKKQLKIGDWAVGTVKNMHSYDADFFEFERDQRAAMGVPEFAQDVRDATTVAENRFGFYEFGNEAVGMDDASNHRATEHEDE